MSGEIRTNAGTPYTQHIYATNSAGKTFNSGVLDSTKVITGGGWNGLKNWQSLYTVVESTGGITRIGFNANGFMQFDNMRLAYFGSDSPTAIDLTSKIVNAGLKEGSVAGVDSTSIRGVDGQYFTPIGWVAHCEVNPSASWVNVVEISGTSMSEGTKGFETWSPSGNIVQFKVSQQIKAPATGYFKLTADLRCDGSSPSLTDTIIYDGRVFAKVAKYDSLYSSKLGEAEGLNIGSGWNSKEAWRTLSLVFNASIGEIIYLGLVSTSFMQFDNFTLSYYAVNDPNAAVPVKNVGYYTLQKTMDETAASVQNDPIYRMLAADPNLNVTLNVFTDNTATSPVDMTGYDVVIVQESVGGGDGILKPAGPLGLAKFLVPTLFNKTYAFKSGRALSDGSAATGAEATAGVYTITVDVANQSHALFKGFTFTGNAVAMFTAGASDLGAAGAKALNLANDVSGVEGTLLGYPTGSTPSISVNDIPAGTTIGDQLTQARIITVGINFGAMCAGDGANITDANYILWRNAVYVLAGLDVPSTLVGIENVSVAPTVDIYPNPTSGYLNIRGIDAMSTVKVFNAMGQQVFVSKANSDMISIDLTRYNQGIYLLQVESNGKAVTSKFIKK